MQLLSSSQREYSGFSLGTVDKTPYNEGSRNDDVNNQCPSKDTRNSAESKQVEQRSKSVSERSCHQLKNKSKNKRNRRKERKRKIDKVKSMKLVGINAAGLMNKLESFENLLFKENPSIFCLQETKLKRPKS